MIITSQGLAQLYIIDIFNYISFPGSVLFILQSYEIFVVSKNFYLYGIGIFSGSQIPYSSKKARIIQGKKPPSRTEAKSGSADAPSELNCRTYMQEQKLFVWILLQQYIQCKSRNGWQCFTCDIVNIFEILIC